MNDILPADIKSWQLVESVFLQLMDGYGYEEKHSLPAASF